MSDKRIAEMLTTVIVAQPFKEVGAKGANCIALAVLMNETNEPKLARVVAKHIGYLWTVNHGTAIYSDPIIGNVIETGCLEEYLIGYIAGARRVIDDDN